MKRFSLGFGLVIFLMMAAAIMAMAVPQQEEISLKALGRAPLSPYLQNPKEAKILLGKMNEEIGEALEVYPGGALGEAVYVALYERLPQLEMKIVEVQTGQKMKWMMYTKGRLLRNVRWEGGKSFQAYQFQLEVEQKRFIFIIPIRCGNITLLDCTELSVLPVPPSIPSISSSAPLTKTETKPIAVKAPVEAPSAPLPLAKAWSPTVKIKIGSGWIKASLPENQTLENSFDFFSLIAAEDSLFYCQDGTAAWLYTHTQQIPFALNQEIGLYTKIINQYSKKIRPIFLGIELELARHFFVTGDYFYVGKYRSELESLQENMLIKELRLLGSYYTNTHNNSINDFCACPKTYVYYLGLEREKDEGRTIQNLNVHEWSVGAKYEIKIAKKFYFAPMAGVMWQLYKGLIETEERVIYLFPFKEETIREDVVIQQRQKVKITKSSPYLGIALELGPVFVEARRILKDLKDNDDELMKFSPWRVQGGIVLRF